MLWWILFLLSKSRRTFNLPKEEKLDGSLQCTLWSPFNKAHMWGMLYISPNYICFESRVSLYLSHLHPTNADLKIKCVKLLSYLFSRIYNLEKLFEYTSKRVLYWLMCSRPPVGLKWIYSQVLHQRLHPIGLFLYPLKTSGFLIFSGGNGKGQWHKKCK